MIEFRPLTDEERRSPTHLCARCGTEQKRFELHHCVPTARWLAEKAAMRASGQQSIVHSDGQTLRSRVHSAEDVHLSTVHLPADEPHPEVDKTEVDKMDTDTLEVDSEEALAAAREEKRREYEREYKRRKRAVAKTPASAEI